MSFLIKLWYERHVFQWILWPFSIVFQIISILRRCFISQFKQKKYSQLVIVVGNLSVGGVGKTPFVIRLAKELKEKGLSVGIVSRGYKSTIKNYPAEVFLSMPASLVGDEPLLMVKQTQCPVIIGKNRAKAIDLLLKKYHLQVVISDDGLQHYTMGRDIEIIIVDGIRGLGNGFCLPAGPLREGAYRIKQSDFLIINEKQNKKDKGYAMHLKPLFFWHLISEKIIPLSELVLTQSIAAVAGIGHPERFFLTLKKMNISFNDYRFPDHYSFKPQDLDLPEKMVIMTEKDAIKCKPFAKDNWYALRVEAQIEPDFWQQFWLHAKVKELLFK